MNEEMTNRLIELAGELKAATPLRSQVVVEELASAIRAARAPGGASDRILSLAEQLTLQQGRLADVLTSVSDALLDASQGNRVPQVAPPAEAVRPAETESVAKAVGQLIELAERLREEYRRARALSDELEVLSDMQITRIRATNPEFGDLNNQEILARMMARRRSS